MNISFEQYESVQQYLDNEMSADERKLFEDLLRSDPVLQSYTSFEQDLRKSIPAIKRKTEVLKLATDPQDVRSNPEYNHLRSLLSKTYPEEEQGLPPEEAAPQLVEPSKQASKPVKFRYGTKVLLAAASLAAAVAVVVLWLQHKQPGNDMAQSHNQTKNTADTLKNNAAHNSGNSTNGTGEQRITETKPVDYAAIYKSNYRRDNGLTASAIPDALSFLPEAYADKDYKAITDLNLDNLPSSMGADEVNNEQTIQETGHYYKGIALMETGSYQAAAENFQWIIKNAKRLELTRKSKWYASLAYLKLSQPGKAIPLLNELAKSDIIPYNEKAKKILTALVAKSS